MMTKKDEVDRNEFTLTTEEQAAIKEKVLAFMDAHPLGTSTISPTASDEKIFLYEEEKEISSSLYLRPLVAFSQFLKGIIGKSNDAKKKEKTVQ